MDTENEIIVIGSDHAGFAMKEFIKTQLAAMNIPFEDLGTFDTAPSDYPLDIARVARRVSSGTNRRGIVLCGSGIGASITANRFKRVRAALCITPEMARLSRSHNNANILVLAGRLTPFNIAGEILKLWLETPFEGGRHARRAEMIDKIQEQE
ncbi:MAG: ribose 5-phosphate isomerase B [Chitinivibrionales bacterium]|nr:ribose 5-phosphate isomerase B [Chitinivibrionales bacterium]